MCPLVLLSSCFVLGFASPLDNELAPNPVDLSYLGPSIFGEPRESKNLEGWDENRPENPEELGEYAEGDILFPENARNGLVSKTTRWKDGVVPYEISPFYPPKDVQMIKRAMEIYHKYTCIKFRPKTASDKDYLSIVNGNTGCWSSVGRITGRQEVNLQSPYCTSKVGTPMHELMHALGFVHEQNRWERDDFVTIAWQNIKNGHEGNFKKADKGSTDGFGVVYDYRSVMHYSPTAFSTNGKPTIVPKDSSKNVKMGQRDGFSRGDIIKINTMYGCPNKPPGGDVVGGEVSGGGGGGGLLSFLFQIVN
ncbi:zinc metalloproteinase nas-13 [Tribolium castaneum]|uniref:Metalloendopeptidase n=1 Tax=Tribolium castaneum TaxID=7070 RepID=D2A5B2_TRICA|nr:PREDICTED: zinc metalloproteinase nas-13 [Tribolium castaneum]EFA05101.1 Dorsal-ventral patterning protein tolloid-like Protein [Tribolium castaneum]|eukprot:XP_973910.1 PREDICTED: zinc metalloproteinase nas-13 [Tribolium castaneum]